MPEIKFKFARNLSEKNGKNFLAGFVIMASILIGKFSGTALEENPSIIIDLPSRRCNLFQGLSNRRF